MTSPRDDRFRPVTLNNNWVVEYPTDTGGLLRIAPARLAGSYRLEIGRHYEDEGICVLRCQVRLADCDGDLWQAESWYTPGILMASLIDLSRRRPPLWVSSLKAAWPAAFSALEGPFLLEDAPDGFDHRSYRYFYLDSMACFLRFKHLGVHYDVVELDGPTLLVRVREPFGSWNPLALEAADGTPVPPPPNRLPLAEQELNEDELGGNYEHYPPLVYSLDVRRLLFHNAADPDPDRWFDGHLPGPIVFSRVDGKETPQPAVSLQPVPAPAPRKTPGGGVFHRCSLWSEHPRRLLTRAGGVLAVREEYDFLCDACFEVAPGSEREPFDVVRCRLRVADSEGRLWEATTHFTPEVFLEHLIDLSDGEDPAFEDARHDDGPATLLAGVRGGRWDDEAWRHLLVGGWAVSIRFDGQTPRFDILSASQVRARGLVGYRRPIEIDDESHFVVWKADGQAWQVEETSLPAIVFGVSAETLLFRNTTFAVDDGFWHHNDLPIPVVFEPLDAGGEPQEGVTFEPGP